RLDVALDLLTHVLAVNDRKMPIQHRKRIAQDHQIVAVRNSLLFLRKVFGAQKAAAVLDRCFVYRSSGAADAPGVVLNDYFGLFDSNAFGFDLREGVASIAKQRPGLDLLIDQRCDASVETLIGLVFLIGAQLSLAD